MDTRDTAAENTVVTRLPSVCGTRERPCQATRGRGRGARGRGARAGSPAAAGTARRQPCRGGRGGSRAPHDTGWLRARSIQRWTEGSPLLCTHGPRRHRQRAAAPPSARAGGALPPARAHPTCRARRRAASRHPAAAAVPRPRPAPTAGAAACARRPPPVPARSRRSGCPPAGPGHAQGGAY